MMFIANNITTRSPRVERLLLRLRTNRDGGRESPAAMLQELAQRCVEAGAEALEIDTQQHQDRPEVMDFAVRAVQEVASCPLCLSTNSAETLEAGLKACKRPALVNYVSIDEMRLRDMFPLAARYNAQLILLVTDPSQPSDAEEMMRRAAVLVGAANGSGIPNDRILIDPGLLHVTSDLGQRHFVEVMEFLKALPQALDPPVRSTCWLGNASAGAPKHLRPYIEAVVLAALSALGLSSVFLDVLGRQSQRTMNLIKILRHETIYAESLLGV